MQTSFSSYDNALNTPEKVTITDCLRNTSSFTKEMDAAGRTIRTTDPGGSIEYAYSYFSEGGKVRSQTSLTYSGSTTTAVYDLRGNRLKLIDPNAGTITSTYNHFNELISQTDARGYTTTYSYTNLAELH